MNGSDNIPPDPRARDHRGNRINPAGRYAGGAPGGQPQNPPPGPGPAAPQQGRLYADGPQRLAPGQRGPQSARQDYQQEGPQGYEGQNYGEPGYQDQDFNATGQRARERLNGRPPRNGRGGGGGSGGVLGSMLGQDPGTRKLVGGAAIIVVLLGATVGGWALFGSHHEGVPVIGPPMMALKDRPADPGGLQVMRDDTAQSDVTGKGALHLAPLPEQPDAQALAREAAARQQPQPASTTPASDTPAATTLPAQPGGQPAPQPETLPAQPAPANTQASEKPAAETQPAPDQAEHERAEAEARERARQAEEQRQAARQAQEEAAQKRAAARKAAQEAAAEKRASARKAAQEAAAKADKADKTDASTLPPPSTTPASKPAAKTPASADAPSASAAPAGSGHYAVQLGALDSPALARKAWEASKGKAPDLLGGHTPLYSQVTRNGRSYVRLRVGGFADMKAARLFCAKLHAASVNCAPAAF
ncbi:SPOR domain-containing protein [Oecophyllibacter saccharovorans]|uniref:SPOR domain-containing protein n=1 Tax=Oecophyllibacter saccharovorans TaxID=2558360 RepID=A0A506UM98_9PROT|nr:SPOR domain-containing protein [Oecophyllibacter saccharovorans]TPW34458.1 hypothetical protein E3202_08235 [Oecophyllibacter saccharovorans]